MGWGTYVLGGALQGAGAGMALRQKIADEERRDRVLSALRKGEIEVQYQKQGENKAASDKRYADMRREESATDFARETALASAGAAADREERIEKRRWDVEDRNFAATEARRKAAQDRKLEYDKLYGKPIDTVTDEFTGDRTLIYNDPKSKSGVRTVIIPKAARKQPKGSDDDWQTGGQSATPRGGTEPGGKTATRGDIQELADKRGMSYQEAEAWAQRNGYTIR